MFLNFLENVQEIWTLLAPINRAAQIKSHRIGADKVVTTFHLTPLIILWSEKVSWDEMIHLWNIASINLDF